MPPWSGELLIKTGVTKETRPLAYPSRARAADLAREGGAMYFTKIRSRDPSRPSLSQPLLISTTAASRLD